ncbi:MAG: hypothetical protein WD077_09150 [Bacteroidia bacterium]
MTEILKESLPSFYLFKNLHLNEPYYVDTSIESYEWLKKGDSVEELQRQIPPPHYPEDEEKLELFRMKFGDVIPEDEDDYYFDDTPVQLDDEVTDRDIFDDSYTILWICPPDKETIISEILTHLKHKTRNHLDPVDTRDLLEVWEDFLDRIFIYTDDSKAFGSQLVSEVKDELPRRINQLPNGPTDATWEEFEMELL